MKVPCCCDCFHVKHIEGGRDVYLPTAGSATQTQAEVQPKTQLNFTSLALTLMDVAHRRNVPRGSNASKNMACQRARHAERQRPGSIG